MTSDAATASPDPMKRAMVTFALFMLGLLVMSAKPNPD